MAFFDFFKKKKEPISWFADEDPEMQAAIQKAQETFNQFASELDLDSQRVLTALDEALIKYAFPATKKGIEVEHIYLSEIKTELGSISGVVNNAPMYTNAVKEGQRVEIDPLRVSDWLYVIEGKGVGGYTFKLMYERFSDAEKAEYGAHPPFSWIINN